VARGSFSSSACRRRSPETRSSGPGRFRSGFGWSSCVGFGDRGWWFRAASRERRIATRIIEDAAQVHGIVPGRYDCDEVRDRASSAASAPGRLRMAPEASSTAASATLPGMKSLRQSTPRSETFGGGDSVPNRGKKSCGRKNNEQSTSPSSSSPRDVEAQRALFSFLSWPPWPSHRIGGRRIVRVFLARVSTCAARRRLSGRRRGFPSNVAASRGVLRSSSPDNRPVVVRFRTIDDGLVCARCEAMVTRTGDATMPTGCDAAAVRMAACSG